MTTDEPGATRDDGVVQRIVGWLRAGYPDGVPRQDYVALLGILRRTLTPVEVDRVVGRLVGELAEAGDDGVVTPEQIRAQVEEELIGPALPQDVTRVAARLAGAGWPLGSATEVVPPSTSRPGLVGRVVGWLREGYPAGLPAGDFVPLVALLRRRLSDEELAEVAGHLTRAGVLAPDRVDVGQAIAGVTSELPSDEDIARVRQYLVDHGWPVDFPV
ncbi:DUF3349 domain-containing protein [Amnibacterium flavum]|uniref:DUF3349 domain-containing protein n=1 Tax=Amnibacterium flavum TaxID=2173173 RepID=A0A2V1HTH0_9MICO|nr:DUF3349 domain-containing protein [Amnibacterium flavum]PVZ94270.1 hypothetical protein DDQ50_11040 [Amnibacterium flavum]